MDHQPQNLEIRIHKVDGSIERFIQSEAALIERILNEFQPARIFVREKIIIADSNSLTSFPTRQVVRIDLVSEPPFQLILPPGIVDAEELTETEWRARLQNAQPGNRLNQARAQDASVVVFLDVKMAGQQPLFLTLEVCLELLTDQPEAILYPLYPLATPALCFRMRSGGVAILNLVHLTRFTLFPAPPRTPMVTWPANWAKDPQLERHTPDLHGPMGRPTSLQVAS
jgi:hypothetical protein